MDIALEQAGSMNGQALQEIDWLFFVGMIGCFGDPVGLNRSKMYPYLTESRSS
jgi:hypothetical protein